MTEAKHQDLSTQFHAHLQRGELFIKYDPVTRKPLGYPSRQSAEDPNRDLQWKRASGRGKLLSFAVYHQAYSPEFSVPYNVALVGLEEGPTLVATVIVADASQLVIGMELRAQFEQDGRLVFVPFETK